MTRLGIRRDLIYIVLFVFLLSISYVSSTWTYTDPIHANDTYVTNLTVSDNLTLPTQTPITSQYGNLYACSGGVCYVNDTGQANELINKSYADANYLGGGGDASAYVWVNGSNPLIADWDAGGYNISNFKYWFANQNITSLAMNSLQPDTEISVNRVIGNTNRTFDAYNSTGEYGVVLKVNQSIVWLDDAGNLSSYIKDNGTAVIIRHE